VLGLITNQFMVFDSVDFHVFPRTDKIAFPFIIKVKAQFFANSLMLQPSFDGLRPLFCGVGRRSFSPNSSSLSIKASIIITVGVVGEEKTGIDERSM
jgi:hypothetical protein